MLKTHRPVTIFLSTTVLISVCLASTGLSSRVCAQQSTSPPDERERGIKFYNQGNDKEAIEVLRQVVKQRKDDLSAWHYLGLAFARQGKTDDARKAHEQAAKLGEKMLDGLLESVRPDTFSASVKSYRPLLEEAADSADKYLELSSKPSKKKLAEWHDRADFLRDFIWQAEAQDKSGAPTIFAPKDVTTKVRIISRPEPQYTEEARKNQVTGTVVLRAVFAADGHVRAIRPIRKLPYGMTMICIRAARQIKFIPATIDGKPVSQYIQIEYNFNLY